jgi:hypothetical protein
MKNLYLNIVCVRLVFHLYFLQIWSFCFVVLFAHSGCHLKVDFPICFSSTHARLWATPCAKFRLWIFFYSLLLTRTQHRPVFPFLARSSCWSPVVLGFAPVIALLIPLFCCRELVRSAQAAPRSPCPALFGLSDHSSSPIWFLCRCGRACRIILPVGFLIRGTVGQFRYRQTAPDPFSLRSGFDGEVFVSKPPRLNFSLWILLLL